MHAAGHKVIPGALRGGLEQDRRFHFNKSALGKMLANKSHNLMAQHQVARHALAAQIQIAVLQPQTFVHSHFFVYVERRRLGRI